MMRQLVVRVLARSINASCTEHLAELRAAVDRSYPHRSEEWRRDLWREAAERAAKASR